ncbi:MAG: hypothetical protein JW955_14220 [Sedimentisphaerales bacterium]|nr:hypothetical protein [Sedimentisphaerales bacterium]
MREKRRPGTARAILIAAGLIVAVASCSLKQDNRAASPGAAGGAPAASFVANPFCKACHVDFDEEPLVVMHKAAGIGCERCHGESFRHRSDEANITSPELMYPKQRINPTCMMCHPRHEIQQVESHQPILQANVSVLETPSSDEHAPRHCTDCHGTEHRMKARSIEWDKCTGKLLE